VYVPISRSQGHDFLLFDGIKPLVLHPCWIRLHNDSLSHAPIPAKDGRSIQVGPNFRSTFVQLCVVRKIFGHIK
jgi:hypothetical protein